MQRVLWYVTPYFENAQQKWSSDTALALDDGWSYE